VLKQIEKAYPDLIIADLGLPEIPGDEVICRLKANPNTSAIPVIVHTALPRGAPEVERAIAAGAEEYFSNRPV